MLITVIYDADLLTWGCVFVLFHRTEAAERSSLLTADGSRWKTSAETPDVRVQNFIETGRIDTFNTNPTFAICDKA
jgi:hypothetical protein